MLVVQRIKRNRAASKVMVLNLALAGKCCNGPFDDC